MASGSQEFAGRCLKIELGGRKVSCSCVTSGRVAELVLEGLESMLQRAGSPAVSLARAGVEFRTQPLQVGSVLLPLH